MSLISDQNCFTADIARLIAHVHETGWACTFGEAWRTVEQQKIYFDNGRSKTMNSQHLNRLAVDFNFFSYADGKIIMQTDKKSLQWIGDFWEKLDKKNSWGGNWKNFIDCPHFQRNV